MGHGFTAHHSALYYSNQYGGINEAFSDMTSEAAEAYLQSNNTDWMIGGQV